MTAQIPYFSTRPIFFCDISVSNFPFLFQSVFQSVVKALFDIVSDFLNVPVYVRCYAVIIVDSYNIRIVLLN